MLTAAELLAFGAYMALWVDSAVRIQAQIQIGHAGQSPWDAVKARYRPITRRKGSYQWWQRARLGYDDAIRGIIDDIFANAQGSNRAATRNSTPS